MTFQVLSLVLLAAVIHAGWNVWLKLAGDRLVALALMGVGWSIFSTACLPFIGAPFGVASSYLAVSVIVHLAYTLILIPAYRYADLSVAYPIARGSAPLLVSVVSAVWIGEAIGVVGLIAVMLIVAGVIGLGFRAALKDYRAVLFSLLGGSLIAAYTMLDGLGARASASAHAYALWLFILTGIPLLLTALTVHRSRFMGLARPIWVKGLGAGVISASAFWMVIWAMTVAPMGLVSAVRESSVAFVVILGGMMLKERVRWIAVLAILAGVVLVRFAGD